MWNLIGLFFCWFGKHDWQTDIRDENFRHCEYCGITEKRYIFGDPYSLEGLDLEWRRYLLYRICSRCGKTQYLMGEPGGRLFWIDEE